MSFHKTDLNSVAFSPFKAIGDNWAILTGCSAAGFNSMTVSWGAAGVLWGKPCVFVFVRPSRYTYDFMEQGNRFSLSLLPEGMHQKVAVFGSKSGRDCDKYALSGAALGEEDGVKFCAEAETVFLCKKIGAADLTPQWFLDKGVDPAFYGGKDFHRMYIGEVEAVLRAEA